MVVENIKKRERPVGKVCFVCVVFVVALSVFVVQSSKTVNVKKVKPRNQD